MANTNFAFRPDGKDTDADTVALAVTTTTGSVALDGTTPFCVRIANTGTSNALIKFGSSAVVALTTDMPILAGTVEVFTVPVGSTHLAGITASGTATLAITSGGGL